MKLLFLNFFLSSFLLCQITIIHAGKLICGTSKDIKSVYSILIEKDKIILSNLNHFRDFVTTEYIAKVIAFLMKKKVNGLINIGSGKKTHLKKIAIKMASKYKKKIKIADNINPTTMVSDISRLKKLGFKE